MHHFIAIGEFKLELQSGNAQSGSNSTLFRAVWPWNLTDDLEKQQCTSPKHHQAICIISSSYVNSNWSYSPETVKLSVDLCGLDLLPLTLTFCMDVIFVIGNNSWKFHDDTMMGTWWKRCDGRTDRRTDGQTDGLNQSYSCLVAAKKCRLFLVDLVNDAGNKLTDWIDLSIDQQVYKLIIWFLLEEIHLAHYMTRNDLIKSQFCWAELNITFRNLGPG